MTAGSPWAAPTGAMTTTPVLPPTQQPVPGPPTAGPPQPPVAPHPRPPRRGGRALLVAGVSAVVLAAMAGTAAVTYAVAHNTTTGPGSAPSPAPTAQPQYSAADQAAAKQQVCQAFEASARGEQGQGGVRVNGDLNVPLVLRTLNSVVAVQNALLPATPPDVAAAAKKYMQTSVDLTTAAMGNAPIDEVTRLNDVGNTATYAFADVCGLPH
jgi:hypothetical protein